MDIRDLPALGQGLDGYFTLLVTVPGVMVGFGSFGLRGDVVEDWVGGSKEGLARSNERVIFLAGVNSFARF